MGIEPSLESYQSVSIYSEAILSFPYNLFCSTRFRFVSANFFLPPKTLDRIRMLHIYFLKSKCCTTLRKKEKKEKSSLTSREGKLLEFGQHIVTPVKRHPRFKDTAQLVHSVDSPTESEFTFPGEK